MVTSVFLTLLVGFFSQEVLQPVLACCTILSVEITFDFISFLQSQTLHDTAAVDWHLETFLARSVICFAMLSSCSGVNTEFLPNFGSAVWPLEIPSCKVLEGILNGVATARNVQPFRVALMAIYSALFVHAAVHVTLFFLFRASCKNIKFSCNGNNCGSVSSKRWERYW
jgi:hypothetical protein